MKRMGVSHTVCAVAILLAHAFTVLAAECPACGQDSPDGAKFCMHCGRGLIRSCARCDTKVHPGANFCPDCGARLANAEKDVRSQSAASGPGAASSARTPGQLLALKRVFEIDKHYLATAFVNGGKEVFALGYCGRISRPLASPRDECLTYFDSRTGKRLRGSYGMCVDKGLLPTHRKVKSYLDICGHYSEESAYWTSPDGKRFYYGGTDSLVVTELEEIYAQDDRSARRGSKTLLRHLRFRGWKDLSHSPVAVSRDGTLALSTRGVLAGTTRGPDKRLMTVVETGLEGNVGDIAPDNSLVAIGGHHTNYSIYSIADMTTVATLPYPADFTQLTALSFSNGSSLLAVAFEIDTAEQPTGQPLERLLPGYRGAATKAARSAAMAHVITIVDVRARKTLRSTIVPLGPVGFMSFSYDDSLLALSTGKDSMVLDVVELNEVARLTRRNITAKVRVTARFSAHAPRLVFDNVIYSYK